MTLAWFLTGIVLAASASGAYAESGMASIYRSGGHTASGERQNSGAFTAAHRTLPFGTMVQVTNTINGRTIIVRINDRGPFFPGRIIDLSRAEANQLGFSDLAPVALVVLPVPVKAIIP